MRTIGQDALARVLDYPILVDALEAGFRAHVETPVRHRHTIDQGGGGQDASLLLMPAWTEDYIGVKTVAAFPANGDRGLPMLSATYQLLSGRTGQPLALLDGEELTVRRTACASALASRYLSRPDAAHLLMVGTGALAPHLIAAHAAVRPIQRVTVWGRSPEKAAAVAERVSASGLTATASDDLERAVGAADIISCATPARSPLVRGAWMKPGQHLDLVGGFTPEMREADDDAIARARLYVDTRTGALVEAGDVVGPMSRGVITADDVLGDLFDMAAGTCPLRQGADDVTVFKSTGTALEDLVAAILAYTRTDTTPMKQAGAS